MIDKFMDSPEAAVADVHDGATVLIGGFGGAGMPTELIHALIDQGARGLTVVSNNAGNRDTGLAALIKAGRVRKVICSFPKASHSWVFDEFYREGRIELECVPQGISRNACVPRAPAWAAFHADGLRHRTCRGQGNPHHRRARTRIRDAAAGRLRAGQGGPGRPLGQPDLQQERTQFRPRHVHGRAHHHCASPRPRRWANCRPKPS